MTCNLAVKQDQGYLKGEMFNLDAEVEIPVGGVFPIFELAGNNIIQNFFLAGSTGALGTLSIGFYTNDGDLTPIIPKYFADKAIAAPAPGAIVAHTNLIDLDADVKPTGMLTLPGLYTIKELINTILADASYVVPSGFNREDERYTNANTYILGVKSTAAIPVGTHFAFGIEYLGTV